MRTKVEPAAMLELVFYETTGTCELIDSTDDGAETVKWNSADDEEFLEEVGDDAHITEEDFNLIADYLVDSGLIDEDEAANLADHTYVDDEPPGDDDEDDETDDDDSESGNVYDAA